MNMIRNDENNNVRQLSVLRADVDYKGRVCLMADPRCGPIGLVPVQVKQCDGGISGTIGCMTFVDHAPVQVLQDCKEHRVFTWATPHQIFTSVLIVWNMSMSNENDILE